MPDTDAPPGADFDALLAHLPLGDAARRDLRRRMCGPDRHYHDHRHLGLLWARAIAFGDGFRAPPMSRRLACAIAYHDAVYHPGAADNEARSAALWRAAADEAGLPADDIDWVAATIEATADHLAGADDPGRQFMLDLDLTPLGETPAAFARNTELLRAEYAHVDEAAWRRGRREFLARFLAAPTIYRTPAVAAAFEAPARANLRAALAEEGLAEEG